MSADTDELTARELQSLRNLGGDAERAADEITRLRAALAQAGADREPRELDRHGWVRPRADGAKARCGGPAICKHCQGEQLLIAAHPSPAQREPLSDAQIAHEWRGFNAPTDGPISLSDFEHVAHAIERAHGITTSGTKGAA